jgi:hypothetical protein
MIDSREHWPELRAGLLLLVEALAPVFDDDTLSIVREFIEHYEFGVALEWLHSAVIRRSISLSDAESESFRKLAHLMDIDSL